MLIGFFIFKRQFSEYRRKFSLKIKIMGEIGKKHTCNRHHWFLGNRKGIGKIV